MHGKGTFRAGQHTYVGMFFKGVPEGKGKFVTKLGRGELVYQGELMQGEPDGQGVESLPNGDQYEGEFAAGRRHGFGRLKTQRGDMYEGEWFEGKPHGEGVCVYADGSRYHGILANAVCHGKGLYVAQNGNKLLGEFDGGSSNGSGWGARDFPNGDKYVGAMVKGAPQGMGLYCFSDGTRVQGQWSDGWPGAESTHLTPGETPDPQYLREIVFPAAAKKPKPLPSGGGTRRLQCQRRNLRKQCRRCRWLMGLQDLGPLAMRVQSLNPQLVPTPTCLRCLQRKSLARSRHLIPLPWCLAGVVAAVEAVEAVAVMRWQQLQRRLTALP